MLHVLSFVGETTVMKSLTPKGFPLNTETNATIIWMSLHQIRLQRRSNAFFWVKRCLPTFMLNVDFYVDLEVEHKSHLLERKSTY